MKLFSNCLFCSVVNYYRGEIINIYCICIILCIYFVQEKKNKIRSFINLNDFLMTRHIVFQILVIFEDLYVGKKKKEYIIKDNK